MKFVWLLPAGMMTMPYPAGQNHSARRLHRLTLYFRKSDKSANPGA